MKIKGESFESENMNISFLLKVNSPIFNQKKFVNVIIYKKMFDYLIHNWLFIVKFKEKK